MSKKLKFPVAKIRDDGTPAIWLTFSNWMAIRRGLISEYLLQCEHIGATTARQQARRPDSLDTWGQYFERDARDTALKLYRIGWTTHRSVEEKCSNTTTPDELVVWGLKRQEKVFAEQLANLAQKEAVLA